MKPSCFLLFILFVSLFISCNNKKADNNKNKVKIEIPNNIVVHLIGIVSTRKTYAGIQFIKNKRERDSYLKKQKASRPLVETIFDSTTGFLIKKFEKSGIIENGKLFLQKFRGQSDEKTIYVDSSGKRLSLIFFSSQLTGHLHFKLLFETDSIEVDTYASSFQKLNYAFLDIIPGGNKELVFLNEHYIMNGDNFDFMVYEIKIN